MFFDPLYIIMMVPMIILVLWAQNRVKRTFRQFGTIPNQQGLSGTEVARMILNANGLSSVPVRGELTDHLTRAPGRSGCPSRSTVPGRWRHSGSPRTRPGTRCSMPRGTRHSSSGARWCRLPVSARIWVGSWCWPGS